MGDDESFKNGACLNIEIREKITLCGYWFFPVSNESLGQADKRLDSRPPPPNITVASEL